MESLLIILVLYYKKRSALDYRDPLFSVIVFFLIVLISVLLTLGFGKIKSILKQREIENLLKEFDYVEIEEIKVDKHSINALLMLARAYEIKGDYEKALKIYLLVEKQTNSTSILKNIATLYFKAGFLEKAKNIIYQVLKVTPRDKEALKLLIWIDEKLGNYREIVDVLEVFNELGVYLPKEKANALIKLYLTNGCNVKEFCEGVNDFEDIFKKYPFTRREYVAFLFKTDAKKAYEVLDVYKDLDLYWNREDIPDNEKFCTILAAKKKKDCNKKAPFEIEALKYLPQNLGELEFEYICSNCKKVFPLYSTRCPNCHELFSQELIIKLSEKKDIENIEF
jgi:tetratricopeptide (TPR) repeat protein